MYKKWPQIWKIYLGRYVVVPNYEINVGGNDELAISEVDYYLNNKSENSVEKKDCHSLEEVHLTNENDKTKIYVCLLQIDVKVPHQK